MWRLLTAGAVVAVAVVTATLLLREDDAAPPAAKPVRNQAFASSPDPDAPASVWAVGDGADGSPAARELARRIEDAAPDRVLYLGDVYPEGAAGDFRDNYATVYGGLAERTAPTPGNHEWPRHPQGYDRYWRGVTKAPIPPWYAFRIGGWQVLSLNSEADHSAGSPQLTWLRRQLADAKPGTCRIAFWHRPRFSAGRHGDQADTAPLWNAVKGRAFLVLNGHDHDLQRFKPVDGTVELVAGAGGHGLYEVDPDRDGLAFSNDETYGALRLELSPGHVTARFVAADGRTLDTSSGTCG